MTAIPPFKESSRRLVVEVARALGPYLADITNQWRGKLASEFNFDGRLLAALERITLTAGCSHLFHDDLATFLDDLHYFGTRLAKMQVDTRAVARALELFQASCDPYLPGLFPEREIEARAVLEMLSSFTFVIVSGAYFDAKTTESNALLAVLDAELAAGDLSALLKKVLDIGCATFGASVGAILLCEYETTQLSIACSSGLESELPADFRIESGTGFAGDIASSGESSMILDTSSDGDAVLMPILRSRARSLWGVPLKANSEIIGVLIIGFPRPYEWMPTERELMRAMGDRTALAIERARMTEALREREQRIAELSTHLLRVQEDERKRISRELHDETGQALMVIRLYLGMMESGTSSRPQRAKIRETLQVVDRTIEGLRRIIGKLSPLVLQELGLFAALRKEAKDLQKNTGVKARVVISDEVGRLAPNTEQTIYRVVQEALHNVAKHAHASNVLVQMEREGETVHVAVEDDGTGIQTRNNSRGHSFGLAGIKERVTMLGGVSRVISAKGKGTRVEITIPVGVPAIVGELPPPLQPAVRAARSN
ncbi:MAG TPA: GAF domain-containing sensor histidine kinase [Candidatus Angelobacter sp.]|nr:GAF domain-containing sensor histidine kinase [Candidatus Angelobacter sp.]